MAKKKPLKPAKSKVKKKKPAAGKNSVAAAGKIPASLAKLVSYLDQSGVKHNILEHKTVYTAFDAAATLKKKLSEIAKSLLIKADKDYYVAVIPADHNLDLEKLKKTVAGFNKKEVKVIKIPAEKVMNELLKAKNAAMTAFGRLHKLPVIAEKNLLRSGKIIFPSGSFNHSVEMGVKDFMKLEKAVWGKFGAKRKMKKVKSN